MWIIVGYILCNIAKTAGCLTVTSIGLSPVSRRQLSGHTSRGRRVPPNSLTVAPSSQPE